MLEIVRNLLRRKGRTALTVIGVAIGVMALTVLGAMAERLNLMLRGAEGLFAQRIMVMPDTHAVAGVILPEHIARVTTVEGVERVARRIQVPYAGARGFIIGPPPAVIGVESWLFASLELPIGRGRPLREGERGKAVAGAALALDQGWSVGDALPIQGRLFELVGVAARTMTVSDQWLFITVDDAQEVLVESSPFLGAWAAAEANGDGRPNEFGLSTGLEVIWQADADPDVVSRRIQAAVPELTVISPTTMRELLAEQMRLVNLLVIGTSLIGLIVGGVSVMNTMVMAVGERRVEIAVKQAVGASTLAIALEIVGESAAIGLLGGLLGVGGGTLLANALNALGAAEHAGVFVVTGRVVAVAFAFAIGVGAVAGLGPAVYCARFEPADALRHD